MRRIEIINTSLDHQDEDAWCSMEAPGIRVQIIFIGCTEKPKMIF